VSAQQRRYRAAVNAELLSQTGDAGPSLVGIDQPLGGSRVEPRADRCTGPALGRMVIEPAITPISALRSSNCSRRFRQKTAPSAPTKDTLNRFLNYLHTIAIDEICAINVRRVAADAARIYSWVSNVLLPDGLGVIAASQKTWPLRVRASAVSAVSSAVGNV
jgi:hypothetical protein